MANIVLGKIYPKIAHGMDFAPKIFLVLTSSKKKINISKMNSHELHSETRHWIIHKTSLIERICHLYETMSIEDDNRFLKVLFVHPH